MIQKKRFKYPELTLLIFVYALSFAAIALVSPDVVAQYVLPFGIIGIIVSGLMYTYGFTSAIGAVLFPLFALQFDPYLVAIIGGLGALVGDLTILRFIKGNLHKELHRLGQTKLFGYIKLIPGITHPWVLSIVGVLVLSSPLPDELGALLIAEGNKISERYFSILSFLANTAGIFILIKTLETIIV